MKTPATVEIIATKKLKRAEFLAMKKMNNACGDNCIYMTKSYLSFL